MLGDRQMDGRTPYRFTDLLYILCGQCQKQQYFKKNEEYPIFTAVEINDELVEYWLLGSRRVVSVLDSGAEGPGFKSQQRRCRATVLGKLLTPIVPLFTKQQNW